MKPIRKHITELNGYLCAISDINDQVGFRHSYFASCKKTGGIDPICCIKSKFGAQATKNLTNSNLRKESDLIRSYAPSNPTNTGQMVSRTRQPGLTETIVWRIQDYLGLDDYCNETIEHRWISSFSKRDFSCQAIFIATSRYLVWAVFSTQYDEIPK